MFDEPLREAIWWWITITTGYRNVSWDKLHMCGHVICFFVNLNFRWWDPYICRLKSHVVYFFGGLHHRFAGPQLLLSKSPFVAALLVDVSICCRVSLHFHQSDRSFFVLNPMFSTVNLLFLAQLCSENPPCLLVRFHFPIVFWCFPYEIPMFPWFAEKPHHFGPTPGFGTHSGRGVAWAQRSGATRAAADEGRGRHMVDVNVKWCYIWCIYLI